MKVVSKPLEGVLVLEPKVFGDTRGFFLESYNQRVFAEIGIDAHFVQDNHSLSSRNVVRGLHYQVRQVQGKLVRVVAGEILDVVVDLRRRSPTFGRWSSVPLSGERCDPLQAKSANRRLQCAVLFGKLKNHAGSSISCSDAFGCEGA